MALLGKAESSPFPAERTSLAMRAYRELAVYLNDLDPEPAAGRRRERRLLADRRGGRRRPVAPSPGESSGSATGTGASGTGAPSSGSATGTGASGTATASPRLESVKRAYRDNSKDQARWHGASRGAGRAGAGHPGFDVRI